MNSLLVSHWRATRTRWTGEMCFYVIVKRRQRKVLMLSSNITAYLQVEPTPTARLRVWQMFSIFFRSSLNPSAMFWCRCEASMFLFCVMLSERANENIYRSLRGKSRKILASIRRLDKFFFFRLFFSKSSLGDNAHEKSLYLRNLQQLITFGRQPRSWVH